MELDAGVVAIVVVLDVAEPAVRLARRRPGVEAAFDVPAHVTLLFPWLDDADLADGVLDDLGQCVAAEPGFEVTLRRFGRFPRVLYLDPEPAAPFARLTRAIWSRWPQRPPYRGVHGSDVTPHLTVAEFDELTLEPAIEARMGELEASLAPGLPLRQEITHVQVLAFDGRRFGLRAELPLGRRLE